MCRLLQKETHALHELTIYFNVSFIYFFSLFQKSSLQNSGPSENEREGRVINFALMELNNATTLPYKERVDEVIQVRQNTRNAALYHLKLRLTRSDCNKEDLSCDASYDPRFAKKKEVRFSSVML